MFNLKLGESILITAESFDDYVTPKWAKSVKEIWFDGTSIELSDSKGNLVSIYPDKTSSDIEVMVTTKTDNDWVPTTRNNVRAMLDAIPFSAKGGHRKYKYDPTVYGMHSQDSGDSVKTKNWIAMAAASMDDTNHSSIDKEWIELANGYYFYPTLKAYRTALEENLTELYDFKNKAGTGKVMQEYIKRTTSTFDDFLKNEYSITKKELEEEGEDLSDYEDKFEDYQIEANKFLKKDIDNYKAPTKIPVAKTIKAII